MKNNFNDTVNNFAALNRDTEEKARIYSEKDTMSETEISQVLLQAFANNKVVVVQLKEKTLDKKIQPDIVGLVKGYDQDKIIIGDNKIELSNINNIQLQ